jgi:hypothetical protein
MLTRQLRLMVYNRRSDSSIVIQVYQSLYLPYKSTMQQQCTENLTFIYLTKLLLIYSKNSYIAPPAFDPATLSKPTCLTVILYVQNI